MENKEKILKEIGELQSRWLDFNTNDFLTLLVDDKVVRYRKFLNEKDFEKKYLQEAADKISAVYEEKIWQKVQELSAEYEPKKLGYSFTWLTKLKSAANDDEREKILQDWLKEISEKKSAEVATE